MKTMNDMLPIVFLAAIAATSNASTHQMQMDTLVANNTSTNNTSISSGLGCNPQTEVECMKCGYGQDGSPIPVQYCADIVDGCPVEVCCDIRTEETCYNATTGDAYSCARYDEGGCPCQGANETKCGVSEFSSGYCTTLCCDWTIEETCYDNNWEPVSCRKYEDGPCPIYQPIYNGLTSRIERVNYSDSEEELNELFD